MMLTFWQSYGNHSAIRWQYIPRRCILYKRKSFTFNVLVICLWCMFLLTSLYTLVIITLSCITTYFSVNLFSDVFDNQIDSIYKLPRTTLFTIPLQNFNCYQVEATQNSFLVNTNTDTKICTAYVVYTLSLTHIHSHRIFHTNTLCTLSA